MSFFCGCLKENEYFGGIGRNPVYLAEVRVRLIECISRNFQSNVMVRKLEHFVKVATDEYGIVSPH